jgi:hypothetical protein
MNGSGQFKLLLQSFALVVALVCPPLVVTIGQRVLVQRTSDAWPSVPGRINFVVAKQHVDDKNHVSFFGRATYSYAVDGKEYVSDRTDLSVGTKRSDQHVALADVARYQPGMAVTVYYDPRDPGSGIIEKGIQDRDSWLLVGAIVGTLFACPVAFFTLREWLREWYAERAAAAQRPKVPDSEPALDSPLGNRIESFGPSTTNIVAGLIIALLVATGGLGLLLRVAMAILQSGGKLPLQGGPKDWSWIVVGLCAVIVLMLLGGAAALVFFARDLWSHDVEFCENGIRYRKGDVCSEFTWSMVTEIRETILRERSLILRPPFNLLLPRTVSRSYMVRTRAGREYEFTVNSLRNIGHFADLLSAAASQSGICWATVDEES